MTFRSLRIVAIAAGLVVRLTPNEKTHMQHKGFYVSGLAIGASTGAGSCGRLPYRKAGP